jgi:hypothetical protein
MTSVELAHYVETGLATAAVLAPTVGLIGHAFAALPWTWAKTIGNVLNAISVDFGDLKDAKKNADVAMLKADSGSGRGQSRAPNDLPSPLALARPRLLFRTAATMRQRHRIRDGRCLRAQGANRVRGQGDCRG